MEKEKNTDRIFREKLKDFSMPPPAHVWDNVQASLAAQKRKKKLAFVGWISAAAVIVLAFIAGWYFSESKNNKQIITEQRVTNKVENAAPETAIVSSGEEVRIAAVTRDAERQEDSSSEMNKAAVKKIKAEEIKTGKQLIAEAADKKEREEAGLPEIKPVNMRLAAREMNSGLAEKRLVHEKNKLSESEITLVAENAAQAKINAEMETGWKLGMNISPGYASHVASHAESYAQNMNYSGSDGNANVAGGISVQYKTGKRWIVESGAYYSRNGQKSEPSFNLFAMKDYEAVYADAGNGFFSNTVDVSQSKITMNSTAGVISFSETPKGAEVITEIDASRADASASLVTRGDFSQVFEFVEIPLFVRYRLVDKKAGIELLGGFNAGIVVGNNVFVENQYGLQNVGKTSEIAPVNISGTLGVGLNYALSRHFSLAFEPRFSYYLNSINTNPEVDFRPYRFGIVSGIYYEF